MANVFTGSCVCRLCSIKLPPGNEGANGAPRYEGTKASTSALRERINTIALANFDWPADSRS